MSAEPKHALERAFVLQTLQRCGGRPLNQSTLLAAMALAFGAALTLTERKEIIASCEADGWIVSVRDELTGLAWGLTAAGILKLAQLGA